MGKNTYGERPVRFEGNERIYRKLMAMKTADLMERDYTKSEIAKIRKIARIYRVSELAGLVAQSMEGGCVSDCIDEELDIGDRTIYSNDF